jgi:hypothetical protein
MSKPHDSEFRPGLPTRREAIIFRVKSLILQGLRHAQNANDRSVRKNKRSNDLASEPVIGESRTRLWTEHSAAERYLIAGKIHNLRKAIANLNGVEVSGGSIFSFWKNVEKTTRRRGFVEGRELREGCLIPTIGGGLCQLSNALYDAALKANLEIVERHAHTQVLAGSLAEVGRDATVFWNYVDLRFRSTNAFRIEADLSADHLTVRIRGQRSDAKQLHDLTRYAKANGHANSCASCGQAECFRSAKQPVDVGFGTTAFLVDEFVPEFDNYVRTKRTQQDKLSLPIDGKRIGKENYAWTTDGFAEVRQQPVFVLRRALRSRRLAMQGAARQRNLLAAAERLSACYAKQLGFDALHIVVQQNLLPFLWRNGHLGGRTFDVLMTALPMNELQKRLDHAAALHPESRTLADFRAEEDLIAAEDAALAAARKIITPHTEIAAIFRDRSELLPWVLPVVEPLQKITSNKPVIVFPSSTVGRKGCYELRDAIRGKALKTAHARPLRRRCGILEGA